MNTPSSIKHRGASQSLRTLDLATANRQWKKEIARRKDVEKSLRKSEHQSAQLLKRAGLVQDQLRHLSRRILLVQEEERKRISRELHDVIAQLLTGINVRLATLKKEASVNTKGLGKKITSAQRLVEKSVDIVHRFSRELRPPALDDLGLIPALHSFFKRFTEETGIRVSLTASAEVEGLSNAKRTALYRVAQEAMHNVARHAQASRVNVNISKRPGAIDLRIKDNGKAFDVSHMLQLRKSQSLGLLGIRARAEMVGGKFTIESEPGQGTTILIQIPSPKSIEEHHHP
jgi:signal transduction histidine kinase